MAVPDGYNTVPTFRYLEQLAGVGGIGGNVYFVDSGTGADTNDGLTIETALATLDAAIGKCAANNGDVIFIMPGHSESWTTTGAKVVADVAGVAIIGLGRGADRPTFTFGHTGTTWTISAASVEIDNILLVAGVNQLVTFATISGNDCVLGSKCGIEIRDAEDVEVLDAFKVTGDRFKANVLHRGYTGGDENLTTFSMNGVDGAEINVIALGKAQTAVVNFVTAASSNVLIKGIFLVTDTTDLSKNVVDTKGGTTWQVEGFDLGAGCSFSGGSGAAVQKDDVGSITASIGTLVNSGGTATLGGILGDMANSDVATRLTAIRNALYDTGGIASYPAAAAPGDGVSIAEGIRYIVETLIGTLVNSGGTATLGDILGDVANTSIATWLQKIGTLTNSGGTATLGAIIGDPANVDLVTRLINAVNALYDAGITTWPAAAAPGDGKSLAEAIRYIVETLIGGADGATTDTLNGKLGTDTELADRSLYDILNGDGPAAADSAAAPGNDVSFYAVVRAVYNLSVPAAETGETVIDEGDYDWTADYPALLTIAPAAGAPLTDVTVHLDMDKAATGFATVYAAETISLYVERKIDGTNWRREAIVEAALAGNSADYRDMKIVIGDIGVDEQARVTAALSAEVSGVAETDLPYAVYYKGLAAPTITPLTATT